MGGVCDNLIEESDIRSGHHFVLADLEADKIFFTNLVTTAAS